MKDVLYYLLGLLGFIVIVAVCLAFLAGLVAIPTYAIVEIINAIKN